METIHIDLLVEAGYTWAAKLLYEASEEGSICRKYMDSREFRLSFLSKSMVHNTFADVIRFTDLIDYSSEDKLPLMIKHSRWKQSEEHYISLLQKRGKTVGFSSNAIHVDERILQTLMSIPKNRLPWYLATFGNIVGRPYFKHPLYTTFAYKMSLSGIRDLCYGLVVISELKELISDTTSIDVLSALSTYCENDTFLVEMMSRVCMLLDLNSREDRLLFNEKFKPLRHLMSSVIDLSHYYSKLSIHYYCHEEYSFDNVVNTMWHDGVLLDNFSIAEQKSIGYREDRSSGVD